MITGHKYLFQEKLRERGYTWDEVRACVVSEEGDYVTVDETHPAYPMTPKEGHVPPTSGVGSAMKWMLGGVGLAAGAGCKCKERAALMDQHSVTWNLKNRQAIVSWLREEAAHRKLPFWGPGAMLLVLAAIAISPIWANSK